MSKIVKVQDGDYKLIVGSVNVLTGLPSPGTITLDTNPNGTPGQGLVNIKGDLLVEGTTTTVNSETVTIEDNIIVLNTGWDGVATAGRQSGITLNQGNTPDVNIIYDLDITSFDPSGNTSSLGSNPDGSFIFKDDNDNLRALVTNSIDTLGGDLALISSGTGVITVAGTVNYEQQILDYARLNVAFDISRVSRSTNVATVYTTIPHTFLPGDRVIINCTSDVSFNSYDAFGNLSSIVIVDTPAADRFRYANTGTDVALLPPGTATGNVRINPVINDDYIPNMKAVADYSAVSFGSFSTDKISQADTKVQVFDFDVSGSASRVDFTTDGVSRATIDNFGLTVGNIQISNNTIANISNDNVIIDNVLNIANRVTTPTTPIGYVKVYSKATPGTGGTGLYFVNTLGTNDELISKTKALLYSLIL